MNIRRSSENNSYKTNCIIILILASPCFVEAFSTSHHGAFTKAGGILRHNAQHVGLQSRQSHPRSSSSVLFSESGSNDNSEVESSDDEFMMTNSSSTTTVVASTAQFGDVVRLGSSASGTEDSAFFAPPIPMSSKPSTTTTTSADELVQSRKKQNILVAIASIGLGLINYFYQFTHPLSSLQLLSTMQQDHAPQTTLKLLGSNGKPTMVDFWAPWCENCKQLAPTLYQIQQQYGRDVNFVMVNGDDPAAWPLIEAFGVDAIPHMALVEADGTVDTALIGPVPKAWLEADLNTLIDHAHHKEGNNNNNNIAADGTSIAKPTLPYEMLDVFANHPEARRLQVTTIKE